MHRDMMEKNPTEWNNRIRSIPLKRAGVPKDLCGLAILLASDHGSYMTGSRFVVDGGRSIDPGTSGLQAKL